MCSRGSTPLDGDATVRALGLPGPLAGLLGDFVVKLGNAFLADAEKKRNAVWTATGINECIPRNDGEETTGKLTLRRAMLDGQGQVIGSRASSSPAP